MTKVLFVCLGNICRSPLAEGAFLKLLKEQGLGAVFEVDSAGTAAYHVGDAPDPRSCKVAQMNGFKLNHRGRQLRLSDFEFFDWIIVMDEANFQDAKKIAEYQPQLIQKLHFYSEFDLEQKYGKTVPDPYYGTLSDFEKVYDQLRVCGEGLLRKIQN